MEITNLLQFAEREELRRWLEQNHLTERCCWVVMYRMKCPEWDAIAYLDVVEEALCFGWIDSTLKRLPDGRLVQRLSPRRKGSHWTELNKQTALCRPRKARIDDRCWSPRVGESEINNLVKQFLIKNIHFYNSI